MMKMTLEINDSKDAEIVFSLLEKLIINPAKVAVELKHSSKKLAEERNEYHAKANNLEKVIENLKFEEE